MSESSDNPTQDITALSAVELSEKYKMIPPKRGDCDILYAAYLACVQRKVGLSHVDECFDEGEKYRICSAAEPLPLGRRRLNVPKKYEDET